MLFKKLGVESNNELYINSINYDSVHLFGNGEVPHLGSQSYFLVSTGVPIPWKTSNGLVVNGGSDSIMNPYLAHMTDRELLEQIYLLLLQINVKVSEIDNDTKQFGMNVAANLVGEALIANNNDAERRNN